MRSPRQHHASRITHRVSPLAILLLLATSLLPSGSFASLNTPHSALRTPHSPVVGANYTLSSAQFAAGDNGVKEKSLGPNLTLPQGKLDATFTSEATKAPIDFSDVAPQWWADAPAGTWLMVELRTGPDGKRWSEWQEAEVEDVLSPQDSPTQTLAGLIPVNQVERTHRYVQSRVTLHTDKSGLTPVFHELTYSFINAGVTANPPRPQVMVMGNPSDAPKPAMVSRSDWGSPQGKSSPKWTPKYRRVTHIVIHHTATSNADTDFAARVRAIWYYHANTRGWRDIGYNYLIDPNGVIYEGRAGGDDVEAAHAYPFNEGSMGVGMIGSFSKVAPSASAQSAMIDLISWKANQRGIDPLGVETIKGQTVCGDAIAYERPTISGHRDFKGTACGRGFNTSSCPGDKLESMLPQIREAIIAEQPPLRAVFTAHDAPGNLGPGATVEVHISVRNTGALTWPSTGQGAVSLGYKWLTPDGKPAKEGWKAIDTALPSNMAFAETVTLTARLNVPAQTGHYAVVWDLQQEGVGWFSEQGSSRPLRVDVVVGTDKKDKLPPTSEVLPLPVFSNNREIPVRWAGRDDPKGAGLASFDIQYRIIPQGVWTDWKTATSDVDAEFEGSEGYTYGFRSRARDVAGNVETWPEEPDTYTVVDTLPPPIQVDSPIGGYVQPGPLVVRGHTEPGAFVVVNDLRAAEFGGVFTSTLEASGRDFLIHITAADAAGNVSQVEITVQAAQRYNDVSVTHPAFIAVEYLSDQGIISGYDDGTFRPEVAVTRAQFLKTLATALHWGLIKPDEPRFNDVDVTSWMYPYVETAAARGVMDGYSDGTFRPGDGLSRSTAVQSLARAAKWQLVTPNAGHFKDVPRDALLFPYVETAFSHGAVTPDEKGNFNPRTPATRGSMCMMIYGLLADIISNNPPPPPDDQAP